MLRELVTSVFLISTREAADADRKRKLLAELVLSFHIAYRKFILFTRGVNVFEGMEMTRRGRNTL